MFSFYFYTLQATFLYCILCYITYLIMKCSKPSCKNIVPEDDIYIYGITYKKCSACRKRNSENTAAQRKRQREEAQEPTATAAPAIRAQEGTEDKTGNVQKMDGETDNDEDNLQKVSIQLYHEYHNTNHLFSLLLFIRTVKAFSKLYVKH